MTREVPIPNPRLNLKEKAEFAKLSLEDKETIDQAVLECVLPWWQKVAMVVTRAEEKLQGRYPQFTHVFYADRIRLLLRQGRLEPQGNLRYMRFSEVRLPDEN